MKLIELKIYGAEGIPINKDRWYEFNLIESIYSEFLIKDKYWHFFYEDDFNLIRCQKKFVLPIEEILKSKNIQFENCGVWVDTNLHVKKYQDIFLQMFHSFSMISMQDYGEDLYPLMDRVIHCFMNHQFLKNNLEHHSYDFKWEADLVGRYAINRACYDSMFHVSKNKKNGNNS